MAVCLLVVEAVDGFISVFPIDEAHRNYAIGLRSPSSEWEVICDTCSPEWEYTFDFETGDFDFTERIVDQSDRVDGKGWISSGNLVVTTKESGCLRENIPLDDAIVNTVTIYYKTTQVKGTWTWRIQIDASQYDLTSGTGDQENTFTGAWSTQIDLSAYLHFQSSGANDTTAIKAIKLSGTGINPFI